MGLIHLPILTDYVSNNLQKLPRMNRLLVFCACLLVLLVDVNDWTSRVCLENSCKVDINCKKDCAFDCNKNAKFADCTKCKGCENDLAWKPTWDNTASSTGGGFGFGGKTNTVGGSTESSTGSSTGGST